MFCCTGCMNVYAILVECGLAASGMDLRETDLFKRSLELGLISQRPAAPRLQAIPANAPAQDLMLHLSGLWCSSCAWLIEHALGRLRGVLSVEVLFASDLVKVRYSPQYLPPEKIRERIAEVGYGVAEWDPSRDRADAGERRDHLLRLGVAAFLWINVMMLNVAIYVGYFEKIPASVSRYVPYILMALATPAVFYSAAPILRLAGRGARMGVVRMESLLALGILAAWGYSVVQTLSGGNHLYFDTACAIVTLVLVGKWTERSAKEKTSHSIALLHRMMPRKARILDGGHERFVSIDAVRAGDEIVVKAGERIPVDGVVLAGESHVDESVITGESAPVGKTHGSAVRGGSVSIDGVLRIQATSVGSESTLAQVLRTVERALLSRTGVERAVDRASRVFVPVVIGLALLTFLGWRYGASAATSEALMRGIAVLVIACPCALGIATPLAVTAAIGAASKRGILVGESKVLETVARVDVMALDKTGTVTEGCFSVLHGNPQHVPLLASVEALSEHPLGKAIVKHAGQICADFEPAADVEVRKGLGISGSVGARRVFIGSRRMVTSVHTDLLEEGQQWESKGATVAYYGWDGDVKGVIAFGDRVRAGAAELIGTLRRRGVRVLLISGDSARTTRHVAGLIESATGPMRGAPEVEIRAGPLPDEKAATVAQLQREGLVVCMAGDGINDAPALAQADLGIAMGSGTD
ncbi:MAG: heavy metal translocating P-type ATPase, partial [Acidobacteria bacterium]|nr:heavy metal translocating P-type ATPase [Acidobacteriota bacterium]